MQVDTDSQTTETRESPVSRTTYRGVSVIVLTWNGLALLKECFPQLMRVTAQWPMPHEIIVVDNGSTDGTVEYLQSQWPGVHLIALSKNSGFSRANNSAARATRYDTILFLNNDVVLADSFIEPLLNRLTNDGVFAVAPKLFRWDRTTIDDGLRHGEYHAGLFGVSLDTDQHEIDTPHYVTFFCGACMLCKRDMFFALGGFDELFSPYAWEDLDLAYRAWKQGFTIIYEPRAVAYHKREATTRSLFSNYFFTTLVWRNKFFFMWKNLTYGPYLRDHLMRLPWKLLKFLCNGRWRYVCGFLRAIPYIPLVLLKRRGVKQSQRINDKEVLRYSYRPIQAN